MSLLWLLIATDYLYLAWQGVTIVFSQLGPTWCFRTTIWMCCASVQEPHQAILWLCVCFIRPWWRKSFSQVCYYLESIAQVQNNFNTEISENLLQNIVGFICCQFIVILEYDHIKFCKHTSRRKSHVVKFYICTNEHSSSETHFRKANAHQFSWFRASVNVPGINIRVTFNLLLSSLHFQYFMPISFIQEYINQTAPWLPQAFIQSKKCNQSSHFSIFHLLNLYLLKINPVLARVWWNQCSYPAGVSENWFSLYGK